jgi:hypothetical protein
MDIYPIERVRGRSNSRSRRRCVRAHSCLQTSSTVCTDLPPKDEQFAIPSRGANGGSIVKPFRVEAWTFAALLATGKPCGLRDSGHWLGRGRAMHPRCIALQCAIKIHQMRDFCETRHEIGCHSLLARQHLRTGMRTAANETRSRASTSAATVLLPYCYRR